MMFASLLKQQVEYIVVPVDLERLNNTFQFGFVQSLSTVAINDIYR
jgi:hypothetical protein